jgi:hypothetical protein
VMEQSKVKMINREEHLAKLALPKKWKEMRRLWNEKYPRGHKWHYYSSKDPDARNFYRDFARGQQAVIGLRWGLPGFLNQPLTKAKAIERMGRVIRERGEGQNA